jgi:hypothetical protein
VVELVAVGTAPAGHGAQVLGVTLHLGLGNRGLEEVRTGDDALFPMPPIR